jgi:anti-anti-sigma factor
MRAAMYTHDENQRVQLGIKAERPAEAPSVLRVAITANLVATNAPQLRTITDDAIDEGRIVITLDLEHCRYVDARGFGILVALANRANRRGGSVTIAGAHEDLRTVFVGHCIAELFRFEPSEVTP